MQNGAIIQFEIFDTRFHKSLPPSVPKASRVPYEKQSFSKLDLG